jgi:hypothetical protein
LKQSTMRRGSACAVQAKTTKQNRAIIRVMAASQANEDA